jgi:hypothetical protein
MRGNKARAVLARRARQAVSFTRDRSALHEDLPGNRQNKAGSAELDPLGSFHGGAHGVLILRIAPSSYDRTHTSGLTTPALWHRLMGFD